MKTKNQKTKSKSQTKTSKSDERIGGKTYTESDIVFIANKFIQLGLNIQSISQGLKEKAICEEFANANDLQMQERLQKLFIEKDKLINFEDLQKKLLTVNDIETVLKYQDVFQLSVIENLK